MTHTYKVSGLTCDGCSATVKKMLLQTPGVQSVEINSTRNEATVSMAQHISTDTLKAALKNYPGYAIDDKINENTFSQNKNILPVQETERSFLETYKPLLIIFGYITVISFIASDGHPMIWMQYFMAGFFLVFSFFKMLDLRSFANAYSMYDVVAQKIPSYGFVYPFIELFLGLAYVTGFRPFTTNMATLIVMGVSSIGVLQSILNKRKIKCACLGSVFDLPMSTVTLVEDVLMMAMALISLLFLWGL